MWTAFARSGLYLAALALLMRVLASILSPIIDFATSGPNADHETVTTAASWFNVLTVENLTLLAGLAVGVFLLGRAAVERRGMT